MSKTLLHNGIFSIFGSLDFYLPEPKSRSLITERQKCDNRTPKVGKSDPKKFDNRTEIRSNIIRLNIAILNLSINPFRSILLVFDFLAMAFRLWEQNVID